MREAPPARPAPIDRALRFLQNAGEDRFNDAALEIFRFQMERNVPYRRYCERRGLDLSGLDTWSRIPPLPARAFQAFDLAAAPPERTFLTSGTTGGPEKRGRHGLPSLDLYQAAWEEPFRRHVLPDCDRIRTLSVIPGEDLFPQSSLSYMISRILERFGAPGTRVAMGTEGLDRPALDAALRASLQDEEPLLILGTSLAMAAVLDTLPSPIALPAGSRIMDTGGFKGRARETERESLLLLYQERLGVPPRYVVGEYGMTELCSQFYETSLSQPGPRRFEGPSWTRTLAIDPETLGPLPFGERGLLAHWDLANAWTVLAVLTEDIGIVHADGFELGGRAPGAELRGCSIATEELLDGR
jgi:acyl-protein synthetase LuxE